MSFVTHFEDLEDRRTDINICYELLDVVFLMLVARFRRFEAGIPRRHTTIARIIGALCPAGLLAVLLRSLAKLRDLRRAM